MCVVFVLKKACSKFLWVIDLVDRLLRDNIREYNQHGMSHYNTRDTPSKFQLHFITEVV